MIQCDKTGLSGPFINVYPQFLGATEAQQTTVLSIRSMPASFKLIFGFFSDNVPFLGYRRKIYMFLGWIMSSLGMLVLVIVSDLDRVEIVNDDGTSLAPADGAPSIGMLSLSVSRINVFIRMMEKGQNVAIIHFVLKRMIVLHYFIYHFK